MKQERLENSKDSWISHINGIPLATYFYFMSIDEPEYASRDNFIPFSQSSVLINLLYYPFLTSSDFASGTITSIPYDKKYFGYTESKTPKVFKISGDTRISPKDIGTIKRYEIVSREKTRHWTNESKLYQYPYSFITINDYINKPLVIKNEYLPSNIQQIKVKAYQPLTMTGGYTIYVDGYKGDEGTNGANEGMLANAGLDLPTSSNEYAQFMATSKAQFIAQNEAGSRNEWTNFGRGIVSVIGGGIQMGLGAMAIGASGGSATVLGAGSMMGAGAYAMGQGIMDVVQADVTQTNRVEQSQALVSDLMSAPRNVTMSSSDILLSLSRNRNAIYWNRYSISTYYKKKLADYWHFYGYKVNRLMTPNTKNRKYFNYIKTLNANIISNAMDKTEIEMVKSIYNKGIRFWHQDMGEINSENGINLDNEEWSRAKV